MAQTNGIAQEAPTLAAIIEAVAKIEKDSYKPQTEFKIHPDDYDELRKEAMPRLFTLTGARQNEVMGLRIVLDRNAERLPRKVSNVEVRGAAK